MNRVIKMLCTALLVLGPFQSVRAAEPGETRCGAAGSVERYSCLSAYNTNCSWTNTYQRCANTNRAPACNVGDTKCSVSGYVQYCQQLGSDTTWTGSVQRCTADRDPADNAPPGYGGYGQQPYSAPNYGSSNSSAGSAGEPRACSPGQQECGIDRHIRRCVMHGGRPARETVQGSRCGAASGMRY